MNSQMLKKKGLPSKPGVYFFLKDKEIIYIGKATSLRDRTRSYFSKDLIATRGPAVLDMVVQSDNIKWQETDSVLEALILESNLIKKHLPKYNTKEKDNKSFNYVCITKDSLPKILINRGRTLKRENYEEVYGPFPNGLQLRTAMKIIRRIFPYIDDQSSKKNNIVFYKQIGLSPDLDFLEGKKKSSFPNWSGRAESEEIRGLEEKKLFYSLHQEYKNNIKNLKLFFQGKKKSVIVNLKKEMLAHAKIKEFEKAGEVKKRIFALEHINDVALIKEDITQENIFATFRIEAYDIAHMGGKNMVGVMVVVENGEPSKNEYKKFIIRTQSNANDTGALEEVLSRRLRHTEWGLPGLIVVDGGSAQINVAVRVVNRYQFDIPVISVLKDDRHKAKALIGDENLIKKYKKSILLTNSESHRFAISFHKKKRNENFLK